jgi:hypothetical protein
MRLTTNKKKQLMVAGMLTEDFDLLQAIAAFKAGNIELIGIQNQLVIKKGSGIIYNGEKKIFMIRAQTTKVGKLELDIYKACSKWGFEVLYEGSTEDALEVFAFLISGSFKVGYTSLDSKEHNKKKGMKGEIVIRFNKNDIVSKIHSAFKTIWHDIPNEIVV